MATPYRFTAPVDKKAATGLVADVYNQLSRDFLLGDGPLMSLSPAPEILAATWSLLREAEMAGDASRSAREVLAVAIASTNKCAFCTDAHTALAHATGAGAHAESVRRGETPDDPVIPALVAWGTAPGTTLSGPFLPRHAPEFIGTALATHFIGRMVSALLNEQLMPGGLQRSELVRRLAGKALSRKINRRLEPGESLRLLPEIDGKRRPAWAGTSPVAHAFAALEAAAASGADLLSPSSREFVRVTMNAWDGCQVAPGTPWANEFSASMSDVDRPGVRLAVLAAVGPHCVSATDVDEWRAQHPGDGDLIRVLAFGAMNAVKRIERTLTTGSSSPVGDEMVIAR